ncbi:MAG: elongation factor P maturation arginine rhamnosyltransferase EarP [Polaromonas sp.]|nr:elongation factor P maturation arginine rhamnosyltransferase EarP [Polaromonas sp.]
MNRHRQWDIFCKVIDNFGDIGVCWRLSTDLAARGEQVRLWIDDASALSWMAPAGAVGVEVLPWSKSIDSTTVVARLAKQPGDVLVEAFGCDIPREFLALWVVQPAQSQSARCWLNLEYLSAESYVERCHAMPSLVSHGPAAGWTKWFFYPGFTPQTGGLLREPGLLQRMTSFQLENEQLRDPTRLRVSLFCYEPSALAALLAEWSRHGLAGQPVELLVTAGRTAHAVKAVLNQWKSDSETLHITWLPWLSQAEFDRMLWDCDLNFVRGEDSVLRALWAGKPWVWSIYPQDDGAHLPKLEAFLQQLNVPNSLKAFHRAWNTDGEKLVAPSAADLADWRHHATAARTALLEQEDMTSRLLQFVVKNR